MPITVRRLVVILALLASPQAAHADTCAARAFKASLVLENFLNLDFDSWMHQIGVGDFNGDGHPDVVAANFNGVFLMLNAGVTPPQFLQEVKIASGNVQGLAVGDVNGDGKLDIVFTDYNDNLVKTLLGNGDGTFTEHSFTLYEPTRFALADMNGDGKLDIVVMNSFDAPTLSVFPGNGDGTYGSPLSTPIAGFVQSMAIADLDGDGHLDVITAISTPSQIEIRRGNGDGTLGAPAITAEPSYVYSILAADLDGDGHTDLAFSDVGTKSVSILYNDGTGAFKPPVTLGPPSVDPNYLLGPGKPQQLLAGDFLGKGRMDLAMIDFDGLLNIYPSNGDGGYGTPAGFNTPTTPLGMALIDYDGDGRLDFAIANGVSEELNFGGDVWLIANACATTTTTVIANPTLGTSNAPVSVHISGHGPTGTVSVREGSSVLATGAAAVDTPLTVSLPAGDHSLVADYSGDAWNQPSTSDPVLVHVTNATTSISLAVTPNPTTYDESATATATITSSTGDTPTGTFTVTVDGVPAYLLPHETPVGQPTQLSSHYAVGTHTVQAEYNGDATHPPSTSAPVTLVVNKATPALTIAFYGGPASGIAFLGSPETASLSWGVSQPTGLVTLREGSTILGTGCCSIPVTLPAGQHTITATYPGDANYTSATGVGQLAVIDGSAHNAITAFYNGQSVLIYYNAVASATSYRISRLGPGGVVQFIASTALGYADSTVVPNAAYTYSVQALASNNAVLQTTLSDNVSTATFSDEILLPDITPIRAVHFTELKTATDRLRALANLPPMTFSAGTPAAGNLIRASHVIDLRNAISAARAALGVPPFAWTDATLTPNVSAIRATDVQEVRNALR